MKKKAPYTPVSCAIHSEYELLIMHRDKVQLHWHDEDGSEHSGVMMPIDIQTKESEEFLIASDENNTQHQVRLDYIQHIQKIKS